MSTTSTSGVSCFSHSGSEDGRDDGCGEGADGFGAAPEDLASTAASASAAAAIVVVPEGSYDGGSGDGSGEEDCVGSAATATNQASGKV